METSKAAGSAIATVSSLPDHHGGTPKGAALGGTGTSKKEKGLVVEIEGGGDLFTMLERAAEKVQERENQVPSYEDACASPKTSSKTSFVHLSQEEPHQFAGPYRPSSETVNSGDEGYRGYLRGLPSDHPALAVAIRAGDARHLTARVVKEYTTQELLTRARIGLSPVRIRTSVTPNGSESGDSHHADDERSDSSGSPVNSPWMDSSRSVVHAQDHPTAVHATLPACYGEEGASSGSEDSWAGVYKTMVGSFTQATSLRATSLSPTSTAALPWSDSAYVKDEGEGQSYNADRGSVEDSIEGSSTPPSTGITPPFATSRPASRPLSIQSVSTIRGNPSCKKVVQHRPFIVSLDDEDYFNAGHGIMYPVCGEVIHTGTGHTASRRWVWEAVGFGRGEGSIIAVSTGRGIFLPAQNGQWYDLFHFTPYVFISDETGEAITIFRTKDGMPCEEDEGTWAMEMLERSWANVEAHDIDPEQFECIESWWMLAAMWYGDDPQRIRNLCNA